MPCNPTPRRRCRAGLCAALLASAFTVAQASPVIVNGSFDVAVPTNGTGGGWTADGNDGAGGHRAAPGNGVSFSNYFIINAAGQSATDPSLVQVVAGFEIGHRYRIVGDYENAYNTFGNPAALSFGAEIVELGLLSEFSQPAGDAVGSFAIEFVANATSLTLRLTTERNGDDSSYAVDNIAISDITQRVPEPPVPALLVLALAGLAAARRR